MSLVNFIKIREGAKSPSLATKMSAGLDISCLDGFTIEPNHRYVVKTGLSVTMPENYTGILFSKSKLAKRGVITLGGVIDADFNGEIEIILQNMNNHPISIDKGQKVSQMVFMPIDNKCTFEGVSIDYKKIRV